MAAAWAAVPVYPWLCTACSGPPEPGTMATRVMSDPPSPWKPATVSGSTRPKRRQSGTPALRVPNSATSLSRLSSPETPQASPVLPRQHLFALIRKFLPRSNLHPSPRCFQISFSPTSPPPPPPHPGRIQQKHTFGLVGTSAISKRQLKGELSPSDWRNSAPPSGSPNLQSRGAPARGTRAGSRLEDGRPGRPPPAPAQQRRAAPGSPAERTPGCAPRSRGGSGGPPPRRASPERVFGLRPTCCCRRGFTVPQGGREAHVTGTGQWKVNFPEGAETFGQ